MKLESSLTRQPGKPLMIFNTTWTTDSGAQRARMTCLVLGILDDKNMWHPTTQSEDTMNRFSDLLPETWPYTLAVIKPGFKLDAAVRQALLKTPKQCGLLICACDVEDYKAIYHLLNVQTTMRML